MSQEVVKQKRQPLKIELPDTENEPETITLRMALAAAAKAGMFAEDIKQIPPQAVIGKFLKQNSTKSVAAAMIRRNSTNVLKMIDECDLEIQKAKEESNQENLQVWVKHKMNFMQQYSINAYDLSKLDERTDFEPEAQPDPTPSFPANMPVVAPVMAQQVNVIIHEGQKE